VLSHQTFTQQFYMFKVYSGKTEYFFNANFNLKLKLSVA